MVNSNLLRKVSSMSKTVRTLWRDWLAKPALVVALSHMLTGASPALALDLEGFTEPYRTIQVAADETGIIAEMLVREGEKVKSGQALVRLNSDVHRALLAIAEQNMRSKGRLDAAMAELQLRRERLEKLQLLRPDGHARQEEVDRARAEMAVSVANVRAALSISM